MVVSAVALEHNDTIQVLSDAPGRARRFSILIGHWANVRGCARASAVTGRVVEELRRLGVRAEVVVVRHSYAAEVLS